MPVIIHGLKVLLDFCLDNFNGACSRLILLFVLSKYLNSFFWVLVLV